MPLFPAMVGKSILSSKRRRVATPCAPRGFESAAKVSPQALRGVWEMIREDQWALVSLHDLAHVRVACKFDAVVLDAFFWRKSAAKALSLQASTCILCSRLGDAARPCQICALAGVTESEEAFRSTEVVALKGAVHALGTCSQVDAPEVRQRSIVEIGKASETLPLVFIRILAYKLQDDDPCVREAAAASLGNFGARASPAVDVLSFLACDYGCGNRKLSAVAIQAIKKIGPSLEFLEMLEEMLKSECSLKEPKLDKDICQAHYNECRDRRWAAEILGELGECAIRVLPSLLQALTHPSDRCFRQAVCDVLGKLGVGAMLAVPELVTRFLLDDDEVRRAAGKALTALAQTLERKIESKIEDDRMFAITKLAEFALHAPITLEILAHVLHDPCAFVGGTAMLACDALGQARHTNAFTQFMKFFRACHCGLQKIFVLNSDELNPLLLMSVQALGDPKASIRVVATRTLGTLARTMDARFVSSAIAEIVVLLGSRCACVRAAALVALARMAPTLPRADMIFVAPKCIEGLADSEAVVRAAAALSLASVASCDELVDVLWPALQRLRRLFLRDPHPLVKRNTWKALHTIC